MMTLIKQLFLCLLSVYALNAYAEVYKCKDSKGQISYSELFCSNQTDTKIIAAPIEPQSHKLDEFVHELLGKWLPESASTANNSESKASTNRNANYRCDGREYCSQMSSCAEATFFSQNCLNTKMDGDGDGIPCESQWCGH